MGKKSDQPRGKKHRKWGRHFRRPKKARYENRRQRERNKLKRILRSNGESFARQWAEERGVLDLLRKLTSL
jgi:hypothetical protein